MSDDALLLTGLQQLLKTQRTAALGTLTNRGLPFVSMVSFAARSLDPEKVRHLLAAGI